MNDEIKKLWDKACWYYCNLEENEKSIALFEEIIKLDPNNVDAYFWAAYASWEFVAQNEEALVLVDKAIEINPKRADLYILKSWILESLDWSYDSDPIVTALQLEPTWFTPIVELLQRRWKISNQEIIFKTLERFQDIPKPLSDNPKDQMEWQYNFFITGLWCKKYKDKLEKYLEDNNGK